MYEPKVNDYVRWTTALGMVHEGWVYFKAEPSENKKGWKVQKTFLNLEPQPPNEGELEKLNENKGKCGKQALNPEPQLPNKRE